ncbi:hypothetical protein RND81_14G066800 [Saponaria officinalis]|uniref:Uncharacterized protein n=1 Tax=Saponaria officinalis TaxID=3572 RepID=A0AAW1GJ45_SAPOF
MQIRHIIDEEFEDNFSDIIHVTIFNVPKLLRDINPNAYTPQLVSIGPYHYFRPELRQMEKYKISSAKRIRNLNGYIKFDSIVDRFLKAEHKIRACYHRSLDVNSETLAWMMAIDAAFLLEVIDTYGTKDGSNVISRISSRMSHLVDYSRRRSAHHDILRDVIMLENQIPLFILRDMLQFWSTSHEIADKILGDNLIGLCKDLCPFKMEENWGRIQPCNCDHLLDYLYKILVPKLEETIEISDDESSEERNICKFVLKLKNCVEQIKSKIMFKLPWILISNLPGFAVIRAMLFPDDDGRNNHGNLTNNQVDSQRDRETGPLLVEEIMIPSVVELSKSGVLFIPTNENIMTINFDKQEKKLYLPKISIDVKTEVVLRNLVAYEASRGLGPLVLARYTELMNGIIDTEDDARLLRERGIIYNYLKSDEEVAKMWNGMSKCLRLSRVPFLDQVIENVNKYYDANWKVVLSKVFKSYLILSWQFLAFSVAVSILFLLTLQVFCDVLYCPRTGSAHARW